MPPKKESQKGVEIRNCSHCDGSGTCMKGRTVNVEHSCEWCVKKANTRMDSLFPIVACGYCCGKGVMVIDLKLQVPKGGGGQKNGKDAS